MDPTAHKPKPLSFKHKYKVFVEKITKLIWYIIIILIVIQVVLIGIKILNKPPNERMCWDQWSCFNYCEYAKQKRCVVPEKRDTNTKKQAWKLLLTGKRNIIEVLNENQGYCACEYSLQDKTRLETFYKFYSENNL